MQRKIKNNTIEKDPHEKDTNQCTELPRRGQII